MTSKNADRIADLEAQIAEIDDGLPAAAPRHVAFLERCRDYCAASIAVLRYEDERPGSSGLFTTDAGVRALWAAKRAAEDARDAEQAAIDAEDVARDVRDALRGEVEG